MCAASITKFDSLDFATIKAEFLDEGNSINKKQHHAYKDMPLYKNHLVNTQNMIVHGLPGKGLCDRIIVLGPQLTEPWEKLAERCKELVLIDCDERSMHELCKQLPASVQEKVKLVTCDLSGGAMSYADTASSRDGSVVARINFYTDFKPKVLLPKDLIGTADYVISSQVCSCLTGYVEHLSDKIFSSKFHVGLLDYVNKDVFLRTGYAAAITQFQKTMEERHFADLAMLAKPSGTIYFADNIRETVLHPVVGIVEKTKMILEETLEALPQKFDVITSKDWVWLNNMANEMGFDVRAYLMRKKPVSVEG